MKKKKNIGVLRRVKRTHSGSQMRSEKESREDGHLEEIVEEKFPGLKKALDFKGPRVSK